MSTFWSDVAAAGAKDPKRQYRWVMRVASIPVFVLKKISKPSFTVTETPHKYLNHTYYYPGRVEWNTVSLTLADPVDPDMAGTMAAIIRASGYSPAQNANDLATMSKKKAVAALGNQLEIAQIDADGKDVEVWKLWNPWVKDVKFGDLDYEGDDMTDVEVELRYDWAELHLKAGQKPHDGNETVLSEGQDSMTEYWKAGAGQGSGS